MHLRRFVLLLLFAVIAAQAAPELDPNDLPRVPPTEPSQAVNTFRIKPGLRLELAAAELGPGSRTRSWVTSHNLTIDNVKRRAK